MFEVFIVQLAYWLARAKYRVNARFISFFSIRSGLLAFRQPEAKLYARLEDYEIGDDLRAREILQGLYLFHNVSVNCKSVSPFKIKDPNELWARELHSFEWLRHLGQIHHDLAKITGRELINDWIKYHNIYDPLYWDIPIVIQRLSNWLQYWDYFYDDANKHQLDGFALSIFMQVHFIERVIKHYYDHEQRALGLAIVVFARVALGRNNKIISRSLHRLEKELTEQVLGKHGILSRKPGFMISLLKLLIPLENILQKSNSEVSSVIQASIQELLKTLKYLRHESGHVCEFNGGGKTDFEIVPAILRSYHQNADIDSSAGRSGYYRLAKKGSVVIFDSGFPVPRYYDSESSASALAFEFSTNGHRLVMNCGTASPRFKVWQYYLRQTAAFSSLSVNEKPSRRLIKTAIGYRHTQRKFMAKVTDFQAGGDEERIIAEHNGYCRANGLRHSREIRLFDAGNSLSGIDRLISVQPGKLKQGTSFEIRFHLHPQIEVIKESGVDQVRMRVGSDEIWSFYCDGAHVAIENSVFLTDQRGSQPSLQILLTGEVDGDKEIAWSFSKSVV